MVWSMAWIQHALTTNATLYDANIFHPTPAALAYTDILLPSALLAAPFSAATDNPLVGFNVVLLLTYIFSGYATFLLASRLTQGRPYAFHAALFAGAVYALCPYRFGHITQLNSMTTYWLPLILIFMHRYLEDGRKPKDLLLTGLLFSLNALSGLYYGVFAALMMALFYAAWSLLNREPPKVRDVLYGVPTFAAFGALLALLLGPYLRSRAPPTTRGTSKRSPTAPSSPRPSSSRRPRASFWAGRRRRSASPTRNASRSMS